MRNLKKLTLIGFALIFSISFVSCEDEDVQTWESTNISYMLTMSPDLLKFVSPEVTYVDSNGQRHTIYGVNELDSLVSASYSYAPGIGVWMIQTIEGTNYKAWTLNMTFKDHPFHSYFGVKYKKLDLVEDTTGVVYDFHHSIFTTTVYATSSITTTTKTNWLGKTSVEYGFGSGALVENHISFTKESYYSGKEVEEYIDNLIKTPDKAGFLINDDGDYTKNTDFSL